MISSLHKLLRQAGGKKMIISLTATNENEAALTIVTEFEKLDNSNKLQNQLSLPIAVSGFPPSIDAELSVALSTITTSEPSKVNGEAKDASSSNQSATEIDCL